MEELDINWPAPGKYIIAVSGGADSMVLLDIFACASARRYELIAAHVDHGLRPESASDSEFVADGRRTLRPAVRTAFGRTRAG